MIHVSLVQDYLEALLCNICDYQQKGPVVVLEHSWVTFPRSQGAQLSSAQPNDLLLYAWEKCLIVCLSLSSPSGYPNHVLPPRDAQDEPLRLSHHNSQGASGGEPQPLLERAEPRRSGGVVRFALDGNQTD